MDQLFYTSEGKYVYWTHKGSRVESHEPMTEMDIQQLEEYFS